MQQTPVTPVVRLRVDAWRAWMERLKLIRVEEQAEHVGVSRALLYDVIAGRRIPGEQFIAACMAAYDGAFEELFEVVA